jgi:hypothetical protein
MLNKEAAQSPSPLWTWVHHILCRQPYERKLLLYVWISHWCINTRRTLKIESSNCLMSGLCSLGVTFPPHDSSDAGSKDGKIQRTSPPGGT